MSRTDVMLAVVEMAVEGGASPPNVTITQIAALIDRLDVHSESHQIDVEVLLSVGVTAWTLAKEVERSCKARTERAERGEVDCSTVAVGG